MWAHSPVVLPVGQPAASASAGGAGRPSQTSRAAGKVSIPLELKRQWVTHGRQWLTLDEAQGEEEAVAEAEAELEAEAQAMRLMDYAS